MRSKEFVLGDIDNMPKADRAELIERAKLEVLCDIRFNLDKINQALIDICQHLETGVTVYNGKL
jgi:hypothetical protein